MKFQTSVRFFRFFVLATVVIAQLGQSNGQTTRGRSRWPAAIGQHISQQSDAGSGNSINPTTKQRFPEIVAQSQLTRPVATRKSFIAVWGAAAAANSYRLDVSTDSSFTTFVAGYHDLNVGHVTGYPVTGLNPGKNYYYRVRAASDGGVGPNSQTVSTATRAGAGLVIEPTFDSSITTDPNAPAIEAMISQAVALYESMFTDPITVSILFRYSTTGPDGSPLGSGALAQSNFVVYFVPWDSFITPLKGDGKSSNDAVANGGLPASALSTNIDTSSANGRAIGLDTVGVVDATGGLNGTFDGIVTLNSSSPFQFTRPVGTGDYDALRVTEHEIDEILGLGSNLDLIAGHLRPQDLFSWSAFNVRNVTSVGSRYFSIDSGATNIVNFNQDISGDFGDWLSESCPQAHPYVQNAFACTGQSSDIAADSPEGINLDVIGYDLVATVSQNPFGEIVSPIPGTVLPSSRVTFTWTAGSAARAYDLLIGDETVPEPGGSNLAVSGQTGGLSFTASRLPTDGRTIYVRLWSFVNGSWFTPPQDYVYTAAALAVQTPVVSPTSGTYRKKVTVSMGCATPGASISYTLNGAAPILYSGPFTINTKGKTILKATATKSGVPDSTVVTVTYTIK